MNEDYPFLVHLFTALGYRVELSGRFVAQTLRKRHGDDSLGFGVLPGEACPWAYRRLIDKGVKKIFYPCIPYNIPENQQADNCYNCPIVTSYPANINANMDTIRTGGITFWHPFLPIGNANRLVSRLVQELAAENLSRREIASAVKEAYTELARYKKDIRQEARRVLGEVLGKNRRGIVLAGRPYHIDPEINHGVAEMIQSYGLAVLSEDAVSHLAKMERPLRVVDQWVYHSRLYDAAAFVAGQPNLEMIQLNSFGCGLDAITIDQVKDILEKGNKIHTVIKLDEVNNLGAARIRVRSLIAALNERQHSSFDAVKSPAVKREYPAFFREKKKEHTILAPQMSPIHFRFSSRLRGAGYNVEVLETVDRKAVDEGLKYFTTTPVSGHRRHRPVDSGMRSVGMTLPIRR
jgi:predicted nucleotide-binding protein (sugar kinase/HSP70/actin superfamily)